MGSIAGAVVVHGSHEIDELLVHLVPKLPSLGCSPIDNLALFRGLVELVGGDVGVGVQELVQEGCVKLDVCVGICHARVVVRDAVFVVLQGMDVMSMYSKMRVRCVGRGGRDGARGS